MLAPSIATGKRRPGSAWDAEQGGLRRLGFTFSLSRDDLLDPAKDDGQLAHGRDQCGRYGCRGALVIAAALVTLAIQPTETSADPGRGGRYGCHRDQKDGKYHCHYGKGQVQGPGPNVSRGATSGGQSLLNGSGLNEALSEIIGSPVTPGPAVSSDDLAKALEAINGAPRPTGIPAPEQPATAGQPPVPPDVPQAVPPSGNPEVAPPHQPTEAPRQDSPPEPAPRKPKATKRF